ncbi:amidohydrolase family protein [Ruminococcus sp. OA3]|uniref:amidohydrolase family protein n=1 Tax=Ruminococcus sp. OA3 TaxID=2914164 RepID=UPI001F0673EB|nr:amidohydrolase family protein [Ruminococcus sp. OA3]MCH1982425.1 amidohydrolase family protein [Ruminococcus sp. OA3]
MIQEIYDYVKQLQMIDTHEHLPAYEHMREKNDVITEFLAHYFNVDLVSAGMSGKECAALKGSSLNILEKWEVLKPYWEVCRHTGYGQSLQIAAREIYGIDSICAETIEALDAAYQKGFDGNHYRTVLKEKSKIKVSILDTWGDEGFDREYFITANRIDTLIQPRTGKDMLELEQAAGVCISSFEDYLSACEIRLNQYDKVSHILKLGIAYSRSLDFLPATRAEAEAAFLKLLRSGGGYIDKEEQIYYCDPVLTNYLFRFITGLAQEKGMVMQIHTGIQEGNGNILSNSRPSHLNEIFLEYPKMKFDLFHIGYPYQSELGALCKMFPNVFVDMCWAHIVSPVAARQILDEWLELFSFSKISGFGGDYMLIDGVYGHQFMARNNIARVLSGKVEEGLMDTEQACRIGKALLYDNPARIFGIEE